MPTRIRLQRMGRKAQPSFRIVVTDRAIANGAPAIETIGTYNPRTQPSLIRLDTAAALNWLHEGAEPTHTVISIFKKTGVWEKYRAGVRSEALEESEAVVRLGSDPKTSRRAEADTPEEEAAAEPDGRTPKAQADGSDEVEAEGRQRGRGGRRGGNGGSRSRHARGGSCRRSRRKNPEGAGRWLRRGGGRSRAARGGRRTRSRGGRRRRGRRELAPGITAVGRMDVLTVARVRRAHGLGGEVLVHLETDDGEEIFAPERRFEVRSTGRRPAALETVTIDASRPHRGGFLLKLKGIDDRRSAEALRGAELLLSRDQLRPLDNDEYFLHELIGLEVVDEELGDLGPIVDVYDAGGQVLAAVRIGGRERLFPLHRGTVRKVDMDAGRIEVTLPSGLLEV